MSFFIHLKYKKQEYENHIFYFLLSVLKINIHDYYIIMTNFKFIFQLKSCNIQIIKQKIENCSSSETKRPLAKYIDFILNNVTLLISEPKKNRNSNLTMRLKMSTCALSTCLSPNMYLVIYYVLI